MTRTRGNTNNTKRQSPKRVPPLTVSRAFGQKSPLIEADLQAFLARCFTMDKWQTYTDEERARIIKCLPPSQKLKHDTSSNEESRNGNLSHSEKTHSTDGPIHPNVCPDIVDLIPLDTSKIATDTYIKRAVARYQRDLGDGYYEKSWLDKASRAHQERMDGKFDDYLKQHAEDIFEDSGSLDGNGQDEADDLAQVSEDGEYMDTSRKISCGSGRPRRSR